MNAASEVCETYHVTHAAIAILAASTTLVCQTWWWPDTSQRSHAGCVVQHIIIVQVLPMVQRSCNLTLYFLFLVVITVTAFIPCSFARVP